MSRSSLNLIAISVFAITLSTLLGPLVNLSPDLVATIAFILLALFTLDNFTWEGRGVTLILDWLASFFPHHRARIIRHEAGHFLVAHLVGIPVTKYTLSAWEALKQGQPGFGGVIFDDGEWSARLEQGILSTEMLRRYGPMWMAGIVAETLVYGDAEGGADDLEKLRIVLTHLGHSEVAREQQKQSFVLQSRTLLKAHWKAYEALVAAMEERASVESCYRAIEQVNS